VPAELGYTALAITDECSVAGVVRAHLAARECGLQLIVGSEFRLDDGLRCVLLATDRHGYGQLCRLITRARRAAPEGKYRLRRRTSPSREGVMIRGRGSDEQNLPTQSASSTTPYPLIITPFAGLLALWLPGMRRIRSKPPGSPPPSPAACGSRSSCSPPARIDDGWRRCSSSARARPAARGRGRRAHARTQPPRAAGRAHGHAPRRAGGAGGLCAVPERRAPPAAARAPRGAVSPELLAATCGIAAHCTFSLDELRYEYPREIVPAGETPASWLRRLTQEARSSAGRRARPPRRVRSSSTSSRSSPSSATRPYFLTVHDIVRFARSRASSARGAARG